MAAVPASPASTAASAAAAPGTAGKPTLKTWWELVKAAGASWVDDYAASMGAAISYYTVFSLAPLLLIVISVAGLVFGDEAVRGELFGQLAGLMGADAAKAIQEMLAGVSKPTHGVIGTAVGLLILLVGATTVFGELQDALDRIWRAPERPKGAGLWGLIRARLLSFGMILCLAFLLVVSLVMGAVISALGKWWGPLFGGWEVLAQVVNLAVGFAIVTVIFAVIYKMMPRVHIKWHDVWIGALVTAVLFTIGKFLIGLYIGKSGVASGFGAAGSIVIIFIWVYYSAQIFLLGAEFTWVYAKTLGSMRDSAAADPAQAGQAAGQVADGAPQVPSRSPGEAGTAAEPTPPLAPATLAAARSSLTEVGVGLGLGLALRYLVPRILRRL
jgi:membrane protein